MGGGGFRVRHRSELVSLERGREHGKLLVERDGVERGRRLGILDHLPDEGDLEPGDAARLNGDLRDLNGRLRDRHRTGILVLEFLRNAHYRPRLLGGKRWGAVEADRVLLLLLDEVVVEIVG